jgi:hypothetical protein
VLKTRDAMTPLSKKTGLFSTVLLPVLVTF